MQTKAQDNMDMANIGAGAGDCRGVRAAGVWSESLDRYRRRRRNARRGDTWMPWRQRARKQKGRAGGNVAKKEQASLNPQPAYGRREGEGEGEVLKGRRRGSGADLELKAERGKPLERGRE
jgi:hypothetical protein